LTEALIASCEGFDEAYYASVCRAMLTCASGFLARIKVAV